MGGGPGKDPQVTAQHAEVDASTPVTILEALAAQAARRAQQPAFTILDASGRETRLSFAQLLRQSLRAAGALQAAGMRQGDRVLICLPTGPEVVLATFGAMLAGGVCVPIYPPNPTKGLRGWKERVRVINRVAQPCGAVIANDGRLHAASLLEEIGEDLFTLSPAALGDHDPADPVNVLPSDLAFIQFTSGTTRQPRGVSVSHEALMANVAALAAVMQLEPGETSVSWLPPYHDMGLVGHLFVSMYCGVHQYLVPPLTFMREPVTWLRLLSDTRAVQTTAPNFAYSTCARRIPEAQRAGLDLSNLRLALNGAELVQAETLDAFCTAFVPHGFSREAFRPVYGLAEATLAATFSSPGGPRVDWVHRHHLASTGEAQPVDGQHPDAQPIVSVGHPIPDHELMVVDGDGRDLPDRRVGAIRFRGPSVANGYFNNPQASVEVFRDGWVVTGDLGYRVDGALHVTGRQKEIIIHNGLNYLPQDIEIACLEVPGLRAGRVVAFGTSNPRTGTEDLVLVAEVRRSSMAGDPELSERVRSVVEERTGLAPDRVELIQPGLLPKTTSGKLQRNRVKEAFEAGEPLSGDRRTVGDFLTGRLRSFAGVANSRLRRLLRWQ